MIGIKRIGTFFPKQQKQIITNSGLKSIKLTQMKESFIDEFKRTGDMRIRHILEDFEQMEAISK